MNIEPHRIRDFLRNRKRKEIDRVDLMRAGVLILLFRKNNELCVLLTKRSDEVEHHKGQISFPGGAMDAGDADIVATALREAEEEIGLSAPSVEVLGLFDDGWTPSGFRITPVLGFTQMRPNVRRSLQEVEEIVEVPLSFFLNPRNERVQQFTRDGKQLDVYFYTYGTNEIWGATAAILRAFLRELTEDITKDQRQQP
jgi:8-oxo-dGTP pyrophosphatase MutT (NUDIX family)